MIINVVVVAAGHNAVYGAHNSNYDKPGNWKPVTGMKKLANDLATLAEGIDRAAKLISYLQANPKEPVLKSMERFYDRKRILVTGFKNKATFEIRSNPYIKITTGATHDHSASK